MPEAQFIKPNQLSALDVNLMRPWVEDDGQHYVNVGGEALLLNEARAKFPRLANNALLRKDEWEELDEMVVEEATRRMPGINDLRRFTRNLGGLGVIYDQYESMSEMTEAEIKMSVDALSQEDTIAYELNNVPIPIISKAFRFDLRRIEASRKLGTPIDVSASATASRLVGEAAENMLFNGTAVSSGGFKIYGYTNFPYRNTGNLTAAWTDTVNRNILRDIETGLTLLDQARMHGSNNDVMVYVPTNYWSQLRGDYKQFSEKTFYERIKEYPEIMDVKAADFLTGNNVIMVKMSRDVVDLSIGQDVTTVNWDEKGGLVERFNVMAAMAPRLKRTYANRSGIVHLST